MIATLSRRLEVLQSSTGEEAHDGELAEGREWMLAVYDPMIGEELDRSRELTHLEVLLYRFGACAPWRASMRRRSRSDGRCPPRTAWASARDGSRRRYLSEQVTTRFAGAAAVAWVVWPEAFVMSVGGSCCYLLRDRHMLRVEGEGSRTERAGIRAASATKPEPPSRDDAPRHATHHPDAAFPEPTIECLDLRFGDTLILCNRGLSTLLSDDRKHRLVSAEVYAKARCQALIAAARECDNSCDLAAIVASFLDRRDG